MPANVILLIGLRKKNREADSLIRARRQYD